MHGNRAETKVVHVNPEISGRPDGVEAITSVTSVR